jgi:hypothetical protein
MAIRVSSLTALLMFLGIVAIVGAEPTKKADRKERALFDGKTLAGWKVTNFGGEGEVKVEDGMILLDFGSSLTGITYQGKLPTTNYEISLEAQRLDGNDFFCGLTFPVAKSHCSLILGGWAGSVVGLSSIDGQDASQNETTRFMSFKSKKWYRVRVRVEPEQIQAWVDDEKIVDQNIKDRAISTRVEVDLSKPLGIAAFETRAALRNIRLRELIGN